MNTARKYRWFETRNKLLLFLPFFFSLFKLLYQLVYIGIYSRPFLKQAFRDIDKSKAKIEFSKGIKNRLRQYTIFHGFLAFLMCNAFNRKPKKSELDRFIYLSICAPLFDDLIDFWELSTQEISQLLKGEQIKRMPSIATEMALKYLGLIKDGFDKNQNTEFSYLLEKLILEQSNDASKDKGATAALLYRTLIEEDLNIKESEYLKQLGNLGQYIDDIFDYPRDKVNNIDTWAQQFSILSLDKAYKVELNKLLSLLQDYQVEIGSSYDNQSKWILVTLLSTPEVAISFFKKHADQDGNLPPSHQVCDMELNTNRARLIWNAWKLGNTSI